MNEHSLPGGAVSGVVRIGDTVHRQVGNRAGFVHELLGFFDRAGWPGAPRFLGFDARGREIVSFVDGYVAWRPDASARASVTTWLRRTLSTAALALAGHRGRCRCGRSGYGAVADGGAVRDVRAAWDWVGRHRGALAGR